MNSPNCITSSHEAKTLQHTSQLNTEQRPQVSLHHVLTNVSNCLCWYRASFKFAVASQGFLWFVVSLLGDISLWLEVSVVLDNLSSLTYAWLWCDEAGKSTCFPTQQCWRQEDGAPLIFISMRWWCCRQWAQPLCHVLIQGRTRRFKCDFFSKFEQKYSKLDMGSRDIWTLTEEPTNSNLLWAQSQGWFNVFVKVIYAKIIFYKMYVCVWQCQSFKSSANTLVGHVSPSC